jgi:hypothetical protein
MHLTASVIIQDEESGLHRDIMQWAEQLAPENPSYRHHKTGEDNGDAHLKNLLLHHQVVLPITNGKIDFGPMAASLLLRIRWATHQTGHRQGHRRVSETKGYREASPGGFASCEIGSPEHVVNQELQGFFT